MRPRLQAHKSSYSGSPISYLAFHGLNGFEYNVPVPNTLVLEHSSKDCSMPLEHSFPERFGVQQENSRASMIQWAGVKASKMIQKCFSKQEIRPNRKWDARFKPRYNVWLDIRYFTMSHYLKAAGVKYPPDHSGHSKLIEQHMLCRKSLEDLHSLSHLPQSRALSEACLKVIESGTSFVLMETNEFRWLLAQFTI